VSGGGRWQRRRRRGRQGLLAERGGRQPRWGPRGPAEWLTRGGLNRFGRRVRVGDCELVWERWIRPGAACGP